MGLGKELSQQEILDIREEAKASQVLSPSPEFVTFRKEMFAEIDAASQASGVFPKLHEMVERLSGERQKIIVFDTIELAVGAALPVGTRYAVPLYIWEIGMPNEEIEKGMDRLKLPNFLPGLVIRGWPSGGVTIQFGLDMGADAHKINPRLQFVAHHWRDNKTFSSPYWLDDNTPAEDITQVYDFGITKDLATALIFSDDLEVGLGRFTLGGETYKSNLAEADYSLVDRVTRETKIVWGTDENQKEVKRGFEMIESFYTNTP